MILPLKDILNDCNTYFLGTMVRLIDPDGKGIWVWFDGYHSGKKGYQFNEGGKRDAPKVFYIDKTQIKKYSIEVLWPIGFYNTDDSVIHFQRRGTRMAYKGLCPSYSVQVSSIEKILHGALSPWPATIDALMKLRLKEVKDFNPAIMKYVDEAKYLPLKEAGITLRKKGAFARALSKDFSLVPHHIHKDFLLFFHDTPVAEVLSKDYKIKMLVKEFTPETREFLEPQGAQFL